MQCALHNVHCSMNKCHTNDVQCYQYLLIIQVFSLEFQLFLVIPIAIRTYQLILTWCNSLTIRQIAACLRRRINSALNSIY